MSNTTSFTGSVPENYERYLGPWIFEPFAMELAGRVELETVRDVLEIACGSGRVTSKLRRALPPDVRLVATDISSDMLDIAKNLLRGNDISWLQADAQALPFTDSCFDVLVCQFGLMFVPDKAKALSEAYRVLRPNGRILFGTWDILEKNPALFMADQLLQEFFPVDPPSFLRVPFSMGDEKELARLFEAAGFREISIELIDKECRSPSAADAVTGMLEGSPVALTIQARNPSSLPQIRTALEARLAEKFGDSPLICPMQARFVMAGK